MLPRRFRRCARWACTPSSTQQAARPGRSPRIASRQPSGVTSSVRALAVHQDPIVSPVASHRKNSPADKRFPSSAPLSASAAIIRHAGTTTGSSKLTAGGSNSRSPASRPGAPPPDAPTPLRLPATPSRGGHGNLDRPRGGSGGFGGSRAGCQEAAVIKDPRTLARIKALVIPPAWEDVWICTDQGPGPRGRDPPDRSRFLPARRRGVRGGERHLRPSHHRGRHLADPAAGFSPARSAVASGGFSGFEVP